MSDSAKGNTMASYGKEQVVAIINSVLQKTSSPKSEIEENIYREIVALKEVIESLRHDLRSIPAQSITQEHIPDAADELDAVVRLTEQATDKIMSACEVIQGVTGTIDDEAREAIDAEVTAIFEACSFQDITGQRISKVVTALKDIDLKTKKLVGVIEAHFSESLGAHAGESSTSEKTGDAALMNGPQLPGRGISQDDIDRILNEFG